MEAYIVQKESLETVADSIRAKAGISEKLEFPLGWKAAVDGIQTGGGTAGGGDGSPFEVEYTVNIGVGVSVTAEKWYTHMLFNGVRLPRIPDDVLVAYPYAWIRKHTTVGAYQLVLAAYPWYYNSGAVYCSGGESVTEPWYNITIETADTATEWTFNKNTTGNFSVDDARPVLWSNHDIPNGSATATDIYFAGSEPVPTD